MITLNQNLADWKTDLASAKTAEAQAIKNLETVKTTTTQTKQTMSTLKSAGVDSIDIKADLTVNGGPYVLVNGEYIRPQNPLYPTIEALYKQGVLTTGNNYPDVITITLDSEVTHANTELVRIQSQISRLNTDITQTELELRKIDRENTQSITPATTNPEVQAAVNAKAESALINKEADRATLEADSSSLNLALEAIASQYDTSDPAKAGQIRELMDKDPETVKAFFANEARNVEYQLSASEQQQAAAIAQIRSDPAAAAKFYVTMSEDLAIIDADLAAAPLDQTLQAKRTQILYKLCAASTNCDPTTMTGIGATGDLLTVEEMEQKLTEEAKQKATQASADIASGKYDKDFAAYTKRRESYMAAVSVISDYAVKWARDKGYLNWLSLSSWADDVPALQELLDFSNTYLNPDAFAENLCSETYDIRDNDDGAVYQVSQVGIARALATFGSEIRTYENEGRTEFLYVTVAHVVNPGPGNISFEIVMRDITSCASSTCEETHSLMNGAALTLGEGESFSNGQYARTRIEYLPGEYSKVCLRFNKEFPDAQGKREYCRSIKEDSISTGSPVAPQPTATTAPSATGTGGASAAGNNPLEGWS